MKRFLIALLVCVGLFSGKMIIHIYASSSFYPTWTKDGQGWRLVYQDGTIYKNDWFYDVDTGIWYYIRDNGYVLSNAVSPDGLQVSTSGRLIDPQALLKRIYQNHSTWLYQNTAFRYTLILPENLKKMFIGAQNSGETSDTEIEGGVQVEFYPGYQLDVYGSLYTPGVPNHQEVEDFVTYSGLKGKIFIDNNKGRKYITAYVYGTSGVVSANLIGGIPEAEYGATKDALLRVLRGVSTMR